MRCEYLQNEIELRHDAAYLFWFFGIILASQREDAMDGWIGMDINYVRGVGGDSCATTTIPMFVGHNCKRNVWI